MLWNEMFELVEACSTKNLSILFSLSRNIVSLKKQKLASNSYISRRATSSFCKVFVLFCQSISKSMAFCFTRTESVANTWFSPPHWHLFQSGMAAWCHRSWPKFLSLKLFFHPNTRAFCCHDHNQKFIGCWGLPEWSKLYYAPCI